MKIKRIIKDYENNFTKQELSNKYNLNIYKLNKLLKENNIISRKHTNNGNMRKINIDLNCFKNIDTHDKAYLLGLIIADGTIDKNGYGFQLCSKDIEILNYAQYILKSNHKIVTINTYDKRTNKTYTRYNIKFCSKEIVNDLNNLGLTNNKSLNVKIPIINKIYHWDLIRGIFDGDGSIHNSSTSKFGQLQFNIIGSLDTINFIKKIFKEFNLSDNKIIKIITKKENQYIYKLQMCAYNDLKVICNNMYKTGIYKLLRKYDKFQELREYKNLGGINSYKNKIWKQVKCINIQTNTELIFDNIKKCAEYFNIKRTDSIQRVINGKRNTYKNYIIKYI